MAGRKTKLTRDMIKGLANLLAQGATVKDACAIAGISTSLYFSWMSWATFIVSNGDEGSLKTARVSDTLLLEFLDAIERARANSKVLAVQEIRRAGSSSWRHVKTGRIIYREPPPLTWQNRYTGETIFGAPADIKNWELQQSGEVWEYTPGRWQASAWFLERTSPEEYGRKSAEELNVTLPDLTELPVHIYIPDNGRDPVTDKAD